MNKAFIFDMDGVLIDDELDWTREEKTLYPQLFGPEITQKLGNTTGLGLEGIYNKAVSLGATMDKAEFMGSWEDAAGRIYSTSPLTKGIEDLAKFLIDHDYKLGLVSASPIPWVNRVLDRLSFKDKFGIVISLQERTDLHHKPEPDGYLEAMKVLGAEPKDTIILEDSNTGIASAKAAGAFVIGFQENLIPGYQQQGADMYAKDIESVISILNQQLN